MTPAGRRGRLVRRTGEIAVLDTAVSAPVAGLQSVITVLGPPGSGRTALLDHAAGHAALAGARVVRVAGLRAERQTPWGMVRRAFPGLDPHPDAVALGATVLAQARSKPLVLLVDDIQWCDPESASVVCTVARRIRQAPMAVVAADNGTCAHSAEQVAALPADLHTIVRPLPLDEAAVRALCRELHGAEPTPGFAAAVWRAGGGLPAVLVPALAELASSAGPPDSLEAAVDTVRRHRAALIGRVLDGLPAHAVDVLRYLVVSGGADPHAVRTVVGDHDAVRTLDLLHRCGLVLCERGNRPAIGVVDLVLASMDTGDRRALGAAAAAHAHLACAPDEVVGRMLLDTEPIATSWAVRVLERAALHASHRGRDGDAVRLRERLLQEPLEPAHRARVQTDLATVQSVTRPVAADRVLRQVLAGPGPPHERRRAADLLLVRGEPAAIRSAVRSLSSPVDGAWAIAGSGMDGLLRLMAHAASAPDGAWFPPGPEFADGGDPAKAAAEAWALTAVGEECDRAAGLARAALAAPGAALAAPALTAGLVLLLADDHAAAVAAFTDVLARAERTQERVVAATAALCLVAAGLRTGAPADAAVHLARIDSEVPREAQSSGLRWATQAAAALVDLHRGEADIAERGPGAAANDSGPGLGAACLAYARARVRLAHGRYEEALAAAYQSGRWLSGHGLNSPALVPWRVVAAESAAALGISDTVRALVDAETRAARGWATPTVTGRLHLLMARTGPRSERAARLREAERSLRSSPDRLLHAEAVIALAEDLVAAGRVAEAAEALHGIVERVRSAHGSPLAARMAEILPAEASVGRAIPTSVTSCLTRAQSRVVALAASGLSNPEIARLLGVSRRAVEMHLSASYRALGVGGRDELASRNS